MRDYEVTVILKPDLEDESRSEELGRIDGWLTLTEGGAEELSPNYRGLRTLAYPIEKYTEGYYVFYEVSLDPSAISDIERNITYVDEILRHLVVRKDG